MEEVHYTVNGNQSRNHSAPRRAPRQIAEGAASGAVRHVEVYRCDTIQTPLRRLANSEEIPKRNGGKNEDGKENDIKPSGRRKSASVKQPKQPTTETTDAAPDSFLLS